LSDLGVQLLDLTLARRLNIITNPLSKTRAACS
jgi:hypothetical protein